MNIKNILLFSFMCITHHNIDAMDTRLPTEENDFLTLTKTSQYQEYIKALKTNYINNCSETKTDVDTAWKNLLKTNELQVIFHSKYQPIYDNSPTYLNIIKTSQYDTYNRAKNLHSAHRTRTSRASLEETFRCLLDTAEVQCMTPLSIKEPVYLHSKTTQLLNQKLSTNDNAQKKIKQTTHNNNNNNNTQPSPNIQISHFYGIQESVNIMATSEFQAIIQTPKFQAVIQKPEFFVMMQTPQFQNFIKAISSQSSDRAQEALEELLETEAMQLLFETGILSDTIRAKFNAMQETEAYDDYQAIKDYHTIWNTPDSQKTLNDYRETWRSTKEYKELLDAANAEMFLNNSTQTFSDNVLKKYQAIKNRSEYIEYQNAKQLLKENNSDDIQNLVCCGLDLLTEEKGHDFFKTINQETEKHALNNIMQSEEWVTKQEYGLFPMLKSTHDRTSHLQIKAIDFLFDKLEAQLSLAQPQNVANTEFINNSTQKKAKLNNNNNSNSYPNTATPLSNAEIAFFNMTQTQQYQAYDQANKLHIEYNKPETKILLEEALGLLLQTQESQTLLQINNQEKTETNNSQSYSEDVVKKNNAMIATVEWQRFQQAKANYEQNPSSENAKYIFTLYKQDLHATKECQDFIKATNKEAHITNNIANTKKWEAEQSHLNCQSIESMQSKRDNAWKIVQNTEEYQIFKQVELAHQLQGTVETQALLDQCKQLAKETPEYIRYFEIDQQLRTIKGQLQANNNHYTKNNNNNNNT